MKQTINFNNLEVLAPAGNAECFDAALANGADAIYLGLSEFNARMKAQNFTTNNIRDFVKKAHLVGTKIYVTINTLIQDEDFDALVNMVQKLVDAKVDAFIVQDLGVAHVLKNSFDGINLHASTQMGIHNLDGAKVAEKLGFSRIVLSREASLEDIKQIKQNTSLEIEYFVQGALCVAFSGNCYLSALENNASGNEGKCLQLCRLPYTNNLNGKTTYALSTRDLCLIKNLKELIDAGVTSFKIEGRMRHAGYVATATNVYKTAIEKIKNNSFDSNFISECEDVLKVSYSRGSFNKNAYLEKTIGEEVIFSDYQNHIGKQIGKVVSVKPFKNDLFKIEIETTHPLSSGDGLKFIDSKRKIQIASLGVGNTEKLSNGNTLIFSKTKVSAGLDVHLTQDSKNEEKLLKNQNKIKINLKITANSNNKLVVFAENKFASATFETNEILEKAKNTPISKNDFFAQFSKLSDTVFEIDNFEVETDGVFAPKSLLNGARREIISTLENATILANEKHLNAKFNESNYQKILCKKIQTTPKNIVVVEDANFNFESNTIYVYSPKSYSENDVIAVLQKTKPENFALEIPVIMKADDKLVFEKLLQQLPNNICLYVNGIGGLNYAIKGYKVIASPLANIRNTFAIKCLNKLGVTTICASIEENFEFANKHGLIGFAKGLFPLMTFAHCPYKAITKTTCKNCAFDENLQYTSNSKTTYKIKQTKLSNCYFALFKPILRENLNFNVINFKN